MAEIIGASITFFDSTGVTTDRRAGPDAAKQIAAIVELTPVPADPEPAPAVIDAPAEAPVATDTEPEPAPAPASDPEPLPEG